MNVAKGERGSSASSSSPSLPSARGGQRSMLSTFSLRSACASAREDEDAWLDEPEADAEWEPELEPEATGWGGGDFVGGRDKGTLRAGGGGEKGRSMGGESSPRIAA